MPQNLLGIHGVVGLVVAVGDNGVILHATGDAYRAQRVECPTAAHLYAVRVLSPRCAFAVGDHGAVLRWDGERWSTVTMGAKDDELFSVWSCREEGPAAEDSVWIGGRDTLLVHHPATGAEGFLMSTDATVVGMWSSGPDDMWFLCSEGLVLHFNGTESSIHPLPGGGEAGYGAISGSGPSDPVWIVGQSGAIIRGDGEHWETVGSGTEAALTSVCVNGPGDVWVTTGGGQLRHFDGRGWEVAALSPFGYLRSLCMVDGVVWCAGAGGVVLQHRPSGRAGE